MGFFTALGEICPVPVKTGFHAIFKIFGRFWLLCNWAHELQNFWLKIPNVKFRPKWQIYAYITQIAKKWVFFQQKNEIFGHKVAPTFQSLLKETKKKHQCNVELAQNKPIKEHMVGMI